MTRPVFVLGVGRSGTTLLGRILGVHEDVGFLNEPKMLWNIVDPNEDISGFYPASGERRFVRLAADVDDGMRTRAQNLYAHFLWLTHSARVVDKYCELSYRRAYLQALFPDAVLLAIVRSPLAAVSSIVAWSQRSRAGNEDWWGVGGAKWKLMREQLIPKYPDLQEFVYERDGYITELDKALIEWIVGMRALLEPAEPRLNKVIRYEDLLAAAEPVVASVLSHAGLRPSARCLRFAMKVSGSPRTAPITLADCAAGLRHPLIDTASRLGYEL